MCGIVGIIGHSWQNSHLEKATAALEHRGPDAGGFYYYDLVDGRMGMGHRRLSILDLSAAGNQPMIDTQTGNVIAYNGEIYNHQELRKCLPGRNFFSNCDTETLLGAYGEWRERALDRLVGMFAFAIWDSAEQNMFLARDRLGVKPLYYIQTPDFFAFASELKALLASNLIAKRLDPLAIESYLAFGAVQEPDTIINGIRLLPAGHCMRVDVKGKILGVKRYWSSTPFFQSTPETRYRDSVQDEIHHTIHTSVKDRLISDVPLGAFLSGGIDSSLIAGIMTEDESAKAHTFCLDFKEGEYREGLFAEEVARNVGSEHKTVVVKSEDLLGKLDRAFRYMDQPTLDGINSYYVSEVARTDGMTVALSGQGGDEVFAGYPSFRFLPRITRLDSFPAPMIAGTGKLLGLMPSENLRWKKIQDCFSTGRLDIYNAYAHQRGIFWDAIRRKLLTFPSHGAGAEWVKRAVAAHELAHSPVNQVSQLELSCYLRNTLLRDLDVFSMAHSLEVRVPLLDHRLVELVAGVEGSAKLDRHVNKPFLVRAMDSRISDIITKRPKGIFWFPWDQWLRSDLKDDMESAYSGRLIAPASVGLQANEIQKIWRQFLENRGGVSWGQVWSIYVLLRWCKENNVTL